MADNSGIDEAYDLRRIFEKMEIDLIKSLKRNLKRHEREEGKEGFKWEMWQKAKLRNLQKYQEENRKIIGSIMTAADSIIDRAIEGNYKKGQNVFEQIFDKITKKVFRRKRVKLPKDISGNGMEAQPPPEKNFFGINRNKMEAMKKAVCDDMHEAEKAVLRRMDDVYRRTIYNAQVQLASGSKTLTQAIDLATKEFLEKGIDCIEYKNGHRVNIASYAEMALRTASHRSMLLGEGEKRDKWGIHTVIVSSHANTCPLCAPWQGKILIDDVFCAGTKEEADQLNMQLLSDAITAGLLHPNCRHTVTTYFPGITQVPTVPDRENAAEMYKAEQTQRSYERQIRRWRRIAAGSIDPKHAVEAEAKMRDYQSRLKSLLGKYKDLRRDYRREKDYCEGGGADGL